MLIRLFQSYLLILVGLFPVLGYAQGDAAAGKPIGSSLCAACHGGNGVPAITTYPVLAGQSYAYLLKQLRDYKGNKGEQPARINPLMSPNVVALSDQDLQNLAAYFNQMPAHKGLASATSDLAIGAKLWRGGDADRGLPACAGCHGAAGQGNPALYPLLAGQHAEYTVDQLKQYQNETRNNDPAAMMRTIAAKLTPKEINSLAHYIGGLRERLP